MIMRLLYAASPEVFDPASPAATDPDGPGSSPSASSMAGWMSGITDAPGGQQTPEPEEPPAKVEPKPSAKKVDPAPEPEPEPEKPASKVEPKVEPKKDEDDESKWPRNAKDWEKFKTARKESEKKLHDEIAARDARIKEFESKYAEAAQKLNGKPAVDPEAAAEVERIKAENKALTDRIMELDVTKHPKFETYFNGKTEAEIARAKRIVGEDKAAHVERILKLQDPEYRQVQLNDFISDLDGMQQARLAVVIDNLEKVDEERQAEISKAQEHKGKLDSERTTRTETTRKMMESAFEEVVKAVQDPKTGSRIFQKAPADAEGAADWNKGVDARINQAKSILSNNNLPPQKITQIVLDAIAMPVLAQAFQENMKKWKEQVTKLEQQVKDLSAAQPTRSSGGTRAPGSNAEPQSPALKQGTNPFDASRAFAEKMSNWQES